MGVLETAYVACIWLFPAVLAQVSGEAVLLNAREGAVRTHVRPLARVLAYVTGKVTDGRVRAIRALAPLGAIFGSQVGRRFAKGGALRDAVRSVSSQKRRSLLGEVPECNL